MFVGLSQPRSQGLSSSSLQAAGRRETLGTRLRSVVLGPFVQKAVSASSFLLFCLFVCLFVKFKYFANARVLRMNVE